MRSQLNDAKVTAIREALADISGIPGDLAELGVFRGGVGYLMAKACPERTVRLFDTFTGIPWDGYDPAIDSHKPGQFAWAMSDVQDDLRDCPNVTYHPGLFPLTAAGETFALVHLDADLYASTRAGLEYFWPRLSPGGCIIFDDWLWPMCGGVKKAVGEFFAERDDYAEQRPVPYQLRVTKVCPLPPSS